MKRRARRCLGVDIGSTSLKVAELSQDRSGVIVQRLVERPLNLAPDAPADTRWATIVQVLRDLLRESKIATRHAVLALPGHAVFVRRVRLPRTSEERLHRIIRFEARQQIPFPLEQTLLQYQICSTEVEDEVEVLLVAIKREIVEQYMMLIRRLGIRPIRLGVSSFALYNFHMFDMGVEPEEFTLETVVPVAMDAAEEEEEEKAAAEATAPVAPPKAGWMDKLKGMLPGKKKAAPAQSPEIEEVAEPAAPEPVVEEVKAFVNIGASTMDLAIGRTGGSRVLGFARSIPLAGNQLTRQIQERLGCESYAEAERIKREQTAVLKPDLAAPGGDLNEQACRAIMPTVDRMVAEIRRSLDFYISQPDGMAVDRLVLSGGQAVLPRLDSYLEERLGVPVERVREIRNPTCRSNVAATADLGPFLISMGLALSGLGVSCINIDFLPEHLKGWIEFKRKNIQLVVQSGLVGAMLFLASQVGTRMTGEWQQRSTQIQGMIQQSEPLELLYRDAEGRRMMINGLVFMMQRSSAVDAAYGLQRDFFFETLSAIMSVRPVDVTFFQIEIGSNGVLIIDGLSEQMRSAPALTEALGKNPRVEKAVLSRAPVILPTGTVAGGGRLYGFQITALLRDKVSKILATPTPAAWRPGMGPMPPGAPGAPGGARTSDQES